jgi:hypothetical protein
MSKHLPPIPQENLSDKGPGDNAKLDLEDAKPDDPRKRDLSKQGRHGDIAQNTTHQGYQQDR